MVTGMLGSYFWGYTKGFHKGWEVLKIRQFYGNLMQGLQLYDMRAFIDEISPEKQEFVRLSDAKIVVWCGLQFYEENKESIDRDHAEVSNSMKERHKKWLDRAREITHDFNPNFTVPISSVMEVNKNGKLEQSVEHP
jgi:hypothetical protein